MKLIKKQTKRRCEADECEKTAKYYLDFGCTVWRGLHICDHCLKRLERECRAELKSKRDQRRDLTANEPCRVSETLPEVLADVMIAH